MFLPKTDEIFKGLQNVFSIIADISIVGCDVYNKDQDKTLRHMMQICCQENIKLNKDKCHFRCTKDNFGRSILKKRSTSRPQKLYTLTKMLPPTNKKELEFF